MAARDDSVIRGSLITCLILLVLSFALNFILWSWGDTQSLEHAKIDERLKNSQNELRTTEEQRLTLLKMMGSEQMSQDEYESLKETSSGDDPNAKQFDAVALKFYNDMKVYPPDQPIQDRHYGKLTDFFVNTVRGRNDQVTTLQKDYQTFKVTKDAEVETARAAQQVAEDEAKKLNTQLEDERTLYAKDRNDMLTKMEQAKDSKTQSERNLQALQRSAGLEKSQLVQRAQQLGNTIETQKLELNKLRGGRFESVQGEIRYVLRGGNIVSINLGAADALRPGITFGVIDRDDTVRLQDAEIKASIQITKILGPHFSEARVVAIPKLGNPIITGDAVYSPFWSPGRTVKIALAGKIDIDNDNRPDNSALEGMIIAAGAEIVDNGAKSGRMDPGVRFLVVGESPDLDGRDEDRAAVDLAEIGQAKQRAIEAGVTVIPAWKLQAYLKTLDDSLTTPLGSAVRGKDFPARRVPGPPRRREVDLPEMYKNQRKNVQRNNEIVRP